MQSSPSLIVVDDDASIREALCEYLERQGFRTRGADGGASLDAALAFEPADLVILDLMMPGEDGLSICRRLAACGTPVLMVSAMGETTDRIVGLEVGADDYLAKPFEPRELLARVRAILRRRNPPEESADRVDLCFAGWRLNPSERTLVDPGGRPVVLTAGEYALLRAFVDHPRRLLTRNQLLDLARGPTADSFDRAIDLQVSRLRRKLEGGGGSLIETVRGEGYRFIVNVTRQ